jgi:hypothetical protein
MQITSDDDSESGVSSDNNIGQNALVSSKRYV